MRRKKGGMRPFSGQVERRNSEPLVDYSAPCRMACSKPYNGHMKRFLAIAFCAVLALCLCGCEHGHANKSDNEDKLAVSDKTAPSDPEAPVHISAEDAKAQLDLTEDYRDSFVHGDKPAEYQKYIVLHDTEGTGSPESVVDWWDSNGNLIAAHFVIGRDGSIVQCVPLDKIAHHAGWGDTGHNEYFGVEDSRDDKLGQKPQPSDSCGDYGMNAWSVGIEMVHEGNGDPYTAMQLDALDKLIAYIDAYFGKESTIIDHKMWRSGNSDTSAEFAEYLANYQDHRTHN